MLSAELSCTPPTCNQLQLQGHTCHSQGTHPAQHVQTSSLALPAKPFRSSPTTTAAETTTSQRAAALEAGGQQQQQHLPHHPHTPTPTKPTSPWQQQQATHTLPQPSLPPQLLPARLAAAPPPPPMLVVWFAPCLAIHPLTEPRAAAIQAVRVTLAAVTAGSVQGP